MKKRKTKVVERLQKTAVELMDLQRENLRIRNELPNIYPGRLNSLGQPLQYILAKNLFCKTSYDVGVDCAASLQRRGRKRKKTVYPDIIVLQKKSRGVYVLKSVIDVKLDLGWLNVDFYGIKKQNNGAYTYRRRTSKFLKGQMEFIRSSRFTYKIKNDQNEVEQIREVEIPKEGVKRLAILFMKQNSHGREVAYENAMVDAGYEFLLVLNKGNIRKPKDRKIVLDEIANNQLIDKTLRSFYRK